MNTKAESFAISQIRILSVTLASKSPAAQSKVTPSFGGMLVTHLCPLDSILFHSALLLGVFSMNPSFHRLRGETNGSGKPVE